MANFHPSDNQLAEYSAGTLDWAVGILVSTHLSLCSECRRKANSLDCIGGALVTGGQGVDLHENAFSDLMARIKGIESSSAQSEATLNGQKPSTPNIATFLEETPAHASPKKETWVETTKHQVIAGSKTLFQKKSRYSASALESIPAVVKKLLPEGGDIQWKRVAPSLEESQLTTHQDKYKVCLHKIKRGGKVVEHDHNGTEITVVLSGCFSDESGNYTVGDFIERGAGQTHRPMASQNQDCLCLSLSDGPIKMTGLLGKAINPFLSFKPS